MHCYRGIIMANHSDSEIHQIKIIGFDLGHGKTALAEVILSSNESEPEIIEIQKEKFQITAIAYDPKGLPIIGDAAFQSVEDSQQVREFEISFKQRPSPNYPNEQKNIITDFVKAVYSELEKLNKIKREISTSFFIGCPSGWSKVDQNNYKQLMSEAKLPKVEVVPESRAAFMHAWKKETFTIKEIRQGILVIDIGSSTTDFTFVTENKFEDYGENYYDLGASLIEQEILQFAIENSPDREAIEKHFQNNKNDKKLWLIYSRKEVKEKYFSNPSLFKNRYASYLKSLQKNLYFEVKANHQIIQTIIDKPLEKLGGKSWKQSFCNQLVTIKKKFDEKRIKPAKILLTGGAARMDFIKEICQEIFPDSPNEMDNEPELCIARGLASWGKLSIKTTKFEAEIKQFLQNSLRDIVNKYFDIYLDKLADFLTGGLLNQVLKTALTDLRDGKIKQSDLESKIQQKCREWLQNSDIKNKTIEKLKEQIKALETEVQAEINSIGAKYGLANDTLGIKSEHSINSNLDVLSKLKDIKDIKDINADHISRMTTAGGSIVFGGAAYLATLIAITDVVLEGILAPITGGLSVILSAIILTPIFKGLALRKALTDEKVEEIIRTKKSELKSDIKQQLAQEKEFSQKILKVSTEAIETVIKEKVDDARILLH